MISKTKLLKFNLDTISGLTIRDIMIDIPFEVNQIVVENGFQSTYNTINSFSVESNLFNNTPTYANNVSLFYYNSVQGVFGLVNKTSFKFKTKIPINGAYNFVFKDISSNTFLTDIEAKIIITFIQN